MKVRIGKNHLWIYGGYGYVSFALGKGDRLDLLGVFWSFTKYDKWGGSCKRFLMIQVLEKKEFILGWR